MNNGIELLGYAAVAIVLVAGGSWALDRIRTPAEPAAVAWAVEAQRSYEASVECKRVVAAWQAGNTGPAEKKYGSNAEEGILLCQQIIKLDDIERARSEQD
jgi:hypothetical protein